MAKELLPQSNQYVRIRLSYRAVREGFASEIHDFFNSHICTPSDYRWVKSSTLGRVTFESDKVSSQDLFHELRNAICSRHANRSLKFDWAYHEENKSLCIRVSGAVLQLACLEKRLPLLISSPYTRSAERSECYNRLFF